MGVDFIVVLAIIYLVHKANIKIKKIKSPCFYCSADILQDETYSIFSLNLVKITKIMLIVLAILRTFDIYVVFAKSVPRAEITNLFIIFSYMNQTLGDIIYML